TDVLTALLPAIPGEPLGRRKLPPLREAVEQRGEGLAREIFPVLGILETGDRMPPAIFFTFVVHAIERPVCGILPERFPGLCTVGGIRADMLKRGEEALASCRREALPEGVAAWRHEWEVRLRRWP